MTYYKLYKYLTTLVISRTKSIQIATTPHGLSLSYRLNTTRAEVGGYLPSSKREVSKECVQGSYCYPANPFRRIQPCPRTLALPGEGLFRQYCWRRLHNWFVFDSNQARHQRLTALIASQFLKILVRLANNEGRGDITLTSPLLIHTSAHWKQCLRLKRLT